MAGGWAEGFASFTKGWPLLTGVCKYRQSPPRMFWITYFVVTVRTGHIVTEDPGQLIGESPLATFREPVEDRQSFSVFISYRVNPDQPLAIALRDLIEGALEPSPKVFVSGAGGLRPSSSGFKPQIQSAVQSANAFIAIIT